MSHSWYVCNSSNRTCFEVGSSIMTKDFEEICGLINQGQLSLNEVIEYHEERLSVFDESKIKQLYEYIKTIPSINYVFVYHEDELIERVFDSHTLRKPVYQVGSLYSNCSTHIFCAAYEEGVRK